jgi:hypothetical protein
MECEAMKLRIKGNSLRLRTTRSETALFRDKQRIEASIRLGSGPEAVLTYGLEHRPDIDAAGIVYQLHAVTVAIPSKHALIWADTDQVGIYGKIDLGDGEPLEFIVEKDFACIDGTDAQNEDAFPNPNSAATC